MKKRIIGITVVLLSIFLVATLIGTFATDVTVATNDNTHNITLLDSTGETTIPSGTSKTVMYQITNTNKGIVEYAVAYSGTNITVKVYNDTIDEVTGTIDYGENKFIKLYIQNTGDTESTASIKTVLGYEFGGELESIVPTGYTLVTEVYTPPKPINLLAHITNLYLNNKDTDLVENNGISYSYASSVSLMNDRQGSMDVGEDEGNIRYYGADPNNYIYFNCETYPETNCETWRIIGIVDGKVKIARASTIGNLAWDQNKNIDSSLTTYTNNWEESSLQLMLNSSYYNGETSGTITYYSGSSGGTEKTLDMSSIGIKNQATRDLISKSTWYLGGYSTSSGLYANNIYTYERTNTEGTTILSGNPFTIDAYIGLMYTSDYSYATDFNSCVGSDLLYYDNEGCYDNDWLYQTSTYQWLLTPNSSDSNYAWFVSSSGDVNYYHVCNSFGVRPVLYLDSYLNIESGNAGTSSDPYRISVS